MSQHNSTVSNDATTASPGRPLLQARDLFCERDERILFQGLDFSLHHGELMQVAGSNGSGKTTLLRILCGLNGLWEGEILWQGQPVHEQRDAFLASLLYIGHRVGVNRILSPRENLRWSGALHGGVDDARIERALEQVGLAGYDDIPCHNLSAGQHQRVALARLYLSPAPLWILDEPFTTLDVHGVRALEQHLAGHVERGGAVLVTTHHALNVPCEVTRLDLDRQKETA
ncbi:MAG: cytochrome c biogenesis heme-transporting ATPase CcmA [Pseudomonadota bacterium]